ncbi:MAG: GntR family transcriptional regulator [Chloroflexi bacterium]|nr:GntR family transcriptional regulator [Chloroflexota bacterium]
MATDTPQLRPLNVLNLRDHIEQKVRDAVLSGVYEPGERLVETAIAAQLGVSRAPVREALAALEQSGLVTNVPRRGYYVVSFTEKDIREVYSLRLLLEIGALARAIPRLTAEGMDEMQHIVEEMTALPDHLPSPQQQVTLDLSFHECIVRAADHSRLYDAWQSMCVQIQLLIGVTTQTHYTSAEQPARLHQQLLEALRARSLPEAEDRLRAHILDAEQRARRALPASTLTSTEKTPCES